MGLMDKEKVLIYLKERINEIDDLHQKQRSCSEFQGWKTKTGRILSMAFGENSPHHTDFKNIKYSLGVYMTSTPDYAFDKAYQKGLDDAKEILKGIVSEIEILGIPSQNQQNLKNTDSKNTFNIIQNQSVNLILKNTFRDHLTGNQYNKLETILEERDKNKKDKRTTKFLEEIGGKSLIEILKSLLPHIWQ